MIFDLVGVDFNAYILVVGVGGGVLSFDIVSLKELFVI